MPKLVVNSNGHVLGEFPVNKDRMVIGSKASNEIPLANVNADNEHAVITRCGDLYVIEDLGSANGTFVHDRKITRLLLSDEDLISVGTSQLRFVEEDVTRGDAGPSANKVQARESAKQERMPKPPRTTSPAAAGGPLATNQCPHCAYQRQPKDAKAPEDKCPSCGLGYATAPGALMSAESKTGDLLEVYDKEVVIKRKMGIKVLLQSLKGDLLEGIKGDKNIPIDSIASIQFKPASTLLAGHITFVLPESKTGFMLAGLDDCTVEFVKREEPKFLEIKAFLDAKIGR
ncbi:FHA domain-containing protein [Sulfuritalea sp.]|uniref:FHA domain-containing protein n=1 Tax=Sulfuritalea sp. TaxID=2480090 RepID=UPI00286DE33B|nr:FHA domain-containing protein [Sulfuritalea sp.]